MRYTVLRRTADAQEGNESPLRTRRGVVPARLHQCSQRGVMEGLVNLFALMQPQNEAKASHLFLPSGGQGWSGNLLPDLESFVELLTICRRGKPMPPRTEVLSDGSIGREKALGLPRRLEALHLLLPLAGGLVRVLRAVVQIPIIRHDYAPFKEEFFHIAEAQAEVKVESHSVADALDGIPAVLIFLRSG